MMNLQRNLEGIQNPLEITIYKFLLVSTTQIKIHQMLGMHLIILDHPHPILHGDHFWKTSQTLLHHYSWILLNFPHYLHLIILHLFIHLRRELNWKLVIRVPYLIDISISVMESWTLLPFHHQRKIHHLMVLSPGYHLNKVLMNPYLNFMDVLTNIDQLLINDLHFDHLFNVDQLASPYQECYQITHMEIDPPFTSSMIQNKDWCLFRRSQSQLNNQLQLPLMKKTILVLCIVNNGYDIIYPWLWKHQIHFPNTLKTFSR